MTVACWGGFETGDTGVLEYGGDEAGAEYFGTGSVYIWWGLMGC
jgi:hypothetical protein